MKKLPFGRLVKRNGRNAYYWKFKIDGNGTTRSTGTDDYDEALKIARRWATEYLAEKEDLIKNDQPRGTPLTVAINEYIEKKVPDLSERYQVDVLRHLDRIENYFGAETSIHEIDHKFIDEFPDFLREQNPRIKPQTINGYLSTFSKLMKLCCRYGYRDTMPYIEKEGNIQRKHGEVYSPDQIVRILQAAKEIDQEKADIDECCLRFVGLGLFSGLRHSEALTVQWDLIDFEKNIGFLLTQKNKSAMPFPLGVMGTYLDQVPGSRRIGHVVQYKHDKNSNYRRPVKSLQKTWRDIRERAELNHDAKYHSLRNTFTQIHFDKFGYDAKAFSRHQSIQALYSYLQKKNIDLIGSKENLFGDEIYNLLKVE